MSHSKRNPKPVDADEQRQRASATLPSRPRNESSTPVREKFDASHRSSSRTRSTRSTSTALGTQTHVQTQVSTPAAATSVKRSPRDATGAQAAIHTGDVQNETDNRPSPRLLKKETPTTEEEASPFESLFSFFQATIDELAGSRKGITLSSIANKIYFNHKFPNYRNGQTGCHRIPVEELLHYNAKELLTRIDPKYRDTEVYAWLEEKSTADFNPIAIKLSDFPYPLIPRNARQKPAAQRGQKGLPNANHTDSSLDRESTPVDRLETPRAGKGLKRRPKKSSLRLTSSKKRPFSEVESGSESDDSRGETKKSHFFQDPDESMEEVADDNDDNTTHEPENAVRIVIQAEKMPSSVPRGHHGAWTCEHDDCDYIVRGGDEEECQARISAHFEHHEQQAERVQLAITEGTRGHNQIKYAYFPPVLLIAHLHSDDPSHTHSPSGRRPNFVTAGLPSPPTSRESFRDHLRQFERTGSQPPPAAQESSSAAPARRSFRSLVQRFRRKPHPVSDNIHKLTAVSQQFVRKDQAPRRAATAGGAASSRSEERSRRAPAYQDELDSVTE